MLTAIPFARNKSLVRITLAISLFSISCCYDSVWADNPSAPVGQLAKPTPPELSVPATTGPIPRSVVVVSDKPKPQDVSVPAVGPLRSNELQPGTPPAGATPPAYRTASEPYAPKSQAPTFDRYGQQINRPVTAASPVPGFATPRSTSGLTQNSTSGEPRAALEPVTGQHEPMPTPATPAEMPLGLEPNRLSQTVRPLPTKATGQLTPGYGSRSVLSPPTAQPLAAENSAATTASQAHVEPLPQAAAGDGNEPATMAIAEPESNNIYGIPRGQTPIAEGEETGEMPTVAPVAGAPVEAALQEADSLGDAPAPSAPQVAIEAAPSADDRSTAGSEIAPSTFREIEPGVSTFAQVLKAWGKPAEQASSEGDHTLLYKMAPFPAVQVSTAGGVVASILIQLDGSLAPAALAERLQLNFIRTVEVRDEQGQPLGRAFPERGVLFSYDPTAEEPLVSQVLLETIDPQAFYLRAETYWRSQAAASLEDLNYVVEQLPGDAAAQHLLARIHLSLGQIDAALVAADKALAIDPQENEYRLTRAQCLSQLGKDQDAEQEATAVRMAEGVNTLAKGRALALLGDLLAEGSRRDFKAAIALHMEAIKLVEPLATDPLVSTRRKAREVLLSATLAVARDVAWGNWNRKEEVVPKWIERADAYARDAIANDGAGVELRVMVIERALAAHAGFKPAVDPARFLDVAEQLTRSLTEATEDELAQQAAEWELGRIYNHAVRLAHLRATVDEGFKYGELAQEKLENGAAGRGSSVQARNEIGRLYFHLGVLEAVHKQDHEKAVAWYDRAYDLLVAEENRSAEDPGDLGEMLVSMGVSYWQVDLKQKALELTTQGTRFVKEAVDQGTLAADALLVPYGNLASMHGELGQADKAREISLTAEKLQRSQLK